MTKRIGLGVSALLVFVNLAYAGASSGGGGGAFVCRDHTTGEIKNSELLDLWEGRNIQGWAIPASADPVDAQIAAALSKLKSIDELLYQKTLSELNHIQTTVNYLPDDAALPPPADANLKYAKKDCPLEGMMYYDGNFDRLQIDKSVFSHLLDNTNVAAAWVHETIYKILRDVSGQTDSTKARLLTACLFSTDDCLGSATWPKPVAGSYKCNSADVEFYYNPDTKEFLYSRIGTVQYGAFLIPQNVPPSFMGYPYVPMKGILSQFGFNQCDNSNPTFAATFNFTTLTPKKISVNTPALIDAAGNQLIPDQFDCQIYDGN